jgi:hypothetical protein
VNFMKAYIPLLLGLTAITAGCLNTNKPASNEYIQIQPDEAPPAVVTMGYAAADFNGDGTQDTVFFAICTKPSTAGYVCRAYRKINNEPVVVGGPILTQADPHLVINIEDYTGDGLLDILATADGPPGIPLRLDQLLTNDGKGNFY